MKFFSHSLAGRASLAFLALSSFFLGCDGRDAAVELPPPEAFEALDQAVQELYLNRRSTLDEALEQHAEGAERARAYGELGQWYQVYGFQESAERCYVEASRLDQSEARWPYLLGHLHLTAGQIDSAEAAFSQALERQPESLPALLWLAETRRQAGDGDGAGELFQRALTAEPARAFAEAGLGRLALARGDFQAAVEHLESALEEQPDASALFYPLSRAFEGVGEKQRASEALLKVPATNRQQIEVSVPDPWLVELDSARVGVLDHLRRGRAAKLAGHLGAALEHFRRGVVADEKSLDARLELAVTLGEMGRDGAAIRELEAARSLFPESRRVYFFLGTLLLKERRFEAAEEQLRASLRLDPENPTVHFNLAQALRSSGQLDAAIESFQRAQELDPGFARAAFWQAVCRLALGQNATLAATPLEDVLLREPAAFEAAGLLARVRAFEVGRAAPDLEAAVQRVETLERQTVLSAESVAMGLAARGDFTGAVAWQRAVLEAVSSAPQPVCAEDLIRERLERYLAGQRAKRPWEGLEVFCELEVAPPPQG